MTARIVVDVARIAYARDPDFEFCRHIGNEDVIGELADAGLMADRAVQAATTATTAVKTAVKAGVKAEVDGREDKAGDDQGSWRERTNLKGNL